MKLVETVKVSDNQTMAIYELSTGVAKQVGAKFMLSRAQFSDYAIREQGEMELVKDRNAGYYEGLHQTRKEAYLTAKLVEASVKFDEYKYAIKKLSELHTEDFTWCN